jgi:hypothetical protein
MALASATVACSERESARTLPAAAPDEAPSPAVSPSLYAPTPTTEEPACWEGKVRLRYQLTAGDERTSEADRRVIRAAAQQARSYFDLQGDSCERRTIAVFADFGTEAGGVRSDTSFMVNPRSPLWLASSPADRYEIVLHEFYHLLQMSSIGPGPTVSDIPPSWFGEGSAEVAAVWVAARSGITNLDEQRRPRLHSARYGDFGPLEDYSSEEAVIRLVNEGKPYPYGLFFVAVDYLVGPEQKLERLALFWSVLGSGVGADRAFRIAFDETLDDFYIRFAGYRATGFR